MSFLYSYYEIGVVTLVGERVFINLEFYKEEFKEDERMKEEDIQQYAGKRCLIILNNNFKYTAFIPNFEGTNFTITDKYGRVVTIECSFIAIIQEEME